MADRRRQVQPRTLAPVRELKSCRRGYKENLPSTSVTKHRGPSFPRVLDGRRWVFLQEGLIAPDQREAFLPWIHHRVPPPPGKKRQELLTRKETLLPRLPQRAQRAQRAGKVSPEDTKALHPLALYSHLEEAMPAQLLLKVLQVLDPEKKLEDTWAYCQDTTKTTKEPTKLLEKHSTHECPGLPEKTPVSHSSQWLYEEKPSRMDLLREDGPFLYENVRRGVRDFCTWATALGSSSIDEEFILKQFDVDYQSEPTCDGLHMMKLSQVPPELRKSVGLNKLQGAEFFQKLGQKGKLWKPQGKLQNGRQIISITPEAQTTAHPESRNSYKPKWVKMRYGAWYLNPNLWKRQRADEPLVDPKDSRKAQEKCKKELQAQEELLADLHGIVAFKDFLLSRGYRMPRFLENMNIGKKNKCTYNKIPIKLTQA